MSILETIILQINDVLGALAHLGSSAIASVEINGSSQS